MTEKNPLDLGLNTKVEPASADALFDNPIDPKDRDTVEKFICPKERIKKEYSDI